MTITLQAVNELIASLESAGEPSIREQKFLKLAKAYQQLAAENVEAKKIISECREYFIAGVMNRIRPTNEGYLHMICDTFADETPATDRIVAGIKADGVEEFAAKLRIPGDDQFFDALAKGVALAADDFAKQLREGDDK
ncbi:hypothetical protein RZP29_12775 [Klebsiella quasipneumoniae subsp. similipneumoniae]|uniref:Uncharacterized protein n=1 Tax=Klebsiella quasipneumoniae subsp. similipneumoniae TaxID=1463164 RepID=A0AAE4MSS2_9ENTR|nr:hypothetical protein [Klebsiella quasipneumoniae]MDV0611491.1 hypothetical protein [Klebsiella quasipneumoniae subsp. similipneumoniae]MDV0641064.1 hypothetical protein [Klebsiella quasipneumoniae subsp. similipneumoniae]MDV0728218.1 hypothetical protein [Klebsiella quasipneumoniae subsp. similipneumoniae]MDV0737875.1 hypothetical protein [Klebsiella quasipneumoniae subsp. similipneumoniae]MDV0763658.1 hypothetical protein [Klebsiella quasipneumoniae subsp. similipneumoniae]